MKPGWQRRYQVADVVVAIGEKYRCAPYNGLHELLAHGQREPDSQQYAASGGVRPPCEPQQPHRCPERPAKALRLASRRIGRLEVRDRQQRHQPIPEPFVGPTRGPAVHIELSP
eukprot:6929813-Prymnesium_polylepis.1